MNWFVIFWVAWFAAGVPLSVVSYRWWMARHNNRAAAIFCAVLTFLAPPSIIFEWTRKP